MNAKATVPFLFLVALIYTQYTLPSLAIEKRSPADSGPRYAPEVQKLLETTYLGHAEELPDPDEPYEVLARYVGYDSHAVDKDLAREIAEWEALAKRYPTSRHALVALARLYREPSGSPQETTWLKQSLSLYVRALRIAMGNGKIRYTHEIADLSAKLRTRERLERIFTEILREQSLTQTDRGHYYLALVDYGDALAKLDDIEGAGRIFEKAVRFYPENNTEAVNLYVRHLLDRKLAAKALEVLDSRYTSQERIQQMLPAAQRLEALRMLNRDTTAAVAEMAAIEDRAAGAVGGYFSATIPAEKGLPTTGEKFSHTIGEDDCRRTDYHTLYCDSSTCFQVYVINMAEVLYNEARAETLGAQTAVLWSIRNRVLQNPKYNQAGGYCDAYVGGAAYRSVHPEWQTLPCNEYASYPNYCFLSQWYCFTVHGATTVSGANQLQYNDAHVDIPTLFSTGLAQRAWRMLNGYIPDISTQWVPPWLSGCSFNCNAEPACYSGTANQLTGSPNGPMEYRSYSYVAANTTDCKQLAGFVCQNAAPNNYFWNRLDHLPVGVIYNVTTSIQGCAVDPDVPNDSISVEIYADGPKGGGGTYVGQTTASISGSCSVGGAGYNGAHAFSYNLPTWCRTGTHTFYIYGINASWGAAGGQLSNSPVTRY